MPRLVPTRGRVVVGLYRTRVGKNKTKKTGIIRIMGYWNNSMAMFTTAKKY